MLQELEEAKRRADDELMALKRGNRGSGGSGARLAVDPKSLVNVQGIISNAESGFRAIVNNEVFGAGESVGRTKITVVKITDNGVVFEYQGKRFSKDVNRD